jgi:glycosyltransferase involved in cell wall biosynthesis
MKECRSLVRGGWRVQLVVADSQGDEIRDGVEIIDIGLLSKNRLWRMITGVYKFFLFANRSKADIFHIHDPELLLAAVALKFFNKRVIYDMHENLPLQIFSKQWLPSFLRSFISSSVKVFERIVLAKMEVVMAADSCVAAYPFLQRVAVVRNFPVISDLAGQASSKFDVFTVGYLGGVTTIRGILDVLAAVQNLRNCGYELKFQCLGPISSEVAGDQHFQSALDQGWLIAPGRVDALDGWATISRCHVGVSMLHPQPNYLEAWPTKMFEYMAMSLPVIISDFPMYQKFINDSKCGLFAESKNVDSIERAILHMISYPKEAIAMGENGKSIALRSYTWDAEFLKLLNLYENS